MITDQVVTYIKDQFSRGVARDKIKSNLLAAGWEEVDILQAFSFANPNGENAGIKIAPAFAVQDEALNEKPIDKYALTKDENSFMPILKQDNPEIKSKPAEILPITTMNMATMASSNPVESIKLNPVNPVLTMRKSDTSSNVLKEFGDEGQIKKISTSGFLKKFALLLFLILIIGNAFIWFFLYPTMQNKMASLNTEKIQNLEDADLKQNERGIDTVDNNIDQTVNNNTVDLGSNSNIENAAKSLQLASSNYYSKYNTYGSVPMKLGSCGAAGTVFVNTAVKSALDEITNIAKKIPQCSLATDDAVNKNHMTMFMVYIPLNSTSGHCVDSSGANIAVNKIPTGNSCVSGL